MPYRSDASKASDRYLSAKALKLQFTHCFHFIGAALLDAVAYDVKKAGTIFFSYLTYENRFPEDVLHKSGLVRCERRIANHDIINMPVYYEWKFVSIHVNQQRIITDQKVVYV